MNERLKKITEKMQQGQPVVGIFVLYCRFLGQ